MMSGARQTVGEGVRGGGQGLASESFVGAGLLYALGGGFSALVLIGVPTVLIPNPWFGREIPPRPLDYVVFALTVFLVAALAATYAWPLACPTRERSLTVGGLLSFFAVGCPVCNKLAVLALGWGGALTYFAPLQPLLGAVAILLLAATLVARLRPLLSR
ncbi:MAG TPA: hypothetical protein VIL85_18075 [Thermomicrobiales bacterium]|jgi:hypothetical protein